MRDVAERANTHDRYVQQVADDLQRVSTQIAELRTRIAELEGDRRLLAALRDTLGAPPDVESSDASSSEIPLPPALPQPRGSVSAQTSSKTPRRKAPGGARKAAAGTRAAAVPSLNSLVLGLMARQREPRLAAEVAAEMAVVHPERPASAPVIRNTLEALVAKGSLERDRQGRSVYYSSVTTGMTRGNEASGSESDGADPAGQAEAKTQS
jgi:hypothetical protein